MPNVNNDVKVKMPLQPQINAPKQESAKAETKDLSNAVMDKLSAAANINKAEVVTKPMEKFELNLSTEELEKKNK